MAARVRFPGRVVDVGNDAPAGGLRVDQFQGGRRGPVGEEAPAAAQDDRVDEQAVLIDQVVLHERPEQGCAAVDLEFVAGLRLQS
jgi:hypothetical protein